MALRSQIFSRDNRFASSWSPEFGLFPGRSSADLRRSHGRLPIAPVPFSLVYGHPLAEKNCWRPLRTHAPFLSTVNRARPGMQHHESVRAPVNSSDHRVVAMTLYSPISFLASLSSSNWKSYDRHQLLWSAGMMARALRARSYSLDLVWRRGGRWRVGDFQRMVVAVWTSNPAN